KFLIAIFKRIAKKIPTIFNVLQKIHEQNFSLRVRRFFFNFFKNFGRKNFNFFFNFVRLKKFVGLKKFQNFVDVQKFDQKNSIFKNYFALIFVHFWIRI